MVFSGMMDLNQILISIKIKEITKLMSIMDTHLGLKDSSTERFSLEVGPCETMLQPMKYLIMINNDILDNQDIWIFHNLK